MNGTLSVNGQPITDPLRQLFDMIAGLEEQVSRLQSDDGRFAGPAGGITQGQGRDAREIASCVVSDVAAVCAR